MKKTDIAMYKSKELGRNKVVYFEKALLNQASLGYNKACLNI